MYLKGGQFFLDMRCERKDVKKKLALTTNSRADRLAQSQKKLSFSTA